MAGVFWGFLGGVTVEFTEENINNPSNRISFVINIVLFLLAILWSINGYNRFMSGRYLLGRPRDAPLPIQ